MIRPNSFLIKFVEGGNTAERGQTSSLHNLYEEGLRFKHTEFVLLQIVQGRCLSDPTLLLIQIVQERSLYDPSDVFLATICISRNTAGPGQSTSLNNLYKEGMFCLTILKSSLHKMCNEGLSLTPLMSQLLKFV